MPTVIGRAVLFGIVAVLRTPLASAQEPPLALDPLTPQERESAAAIAREDRRLRDFLAEKRSRLIYVEFIAVKAAGATQAQEDPHSHRHAEALFYRYTDNSGLRALIDLETRTVVEIARVRGDSVPINVEEVEEAAQLALRDARVERLFGGRMPPFRTATRPAAADESESNRIEGLRTLGATEGDPCYRHRCVVLFFRVANRYVHMNRVVVDLTSQKVLLQGGDR